METKLKGKCITCSKKQIDLDNLIEQSINRRIMIHNPEEWSFFNVKYVQFLIIFHSFTNI